MYWLACWTRNGNARVQCPIQPGSLLADLEPITLILSCITWFLWGWKGWEETQTILSSLEASHNINAIIMNTNSHLAYSRSEIQHQAINAQTVLTSGHCGGQSWMLWPFCVITSTTLILGTFNAHMDKPSDSATSRLLSLTTSFDLHFWTNTPTHLCGHSFDLGFTKNCSRIIES